MLPDPAMTDVASSWTALFAAVWLTRKRNNPPLQPREASRRHLPRVDLFTPAPPRADSPLDDTIAWPIDTPSRLATTIDTVARRLQALPEPHDLGRRSLRYRVQLQRTLREARHALARLDEGTYGTCIDCAAPISLSTLTEKPWASVCSGCAADIRPERARRAPTRTRGDRT